MSTTNLSEYKKLKKLNKVITDLTEIQKLFTVTLQNYSVYKKYTPVQDAIASILDNKVLVDVYLKKFKKSLESLNVENKLE